MFILLFGLVFNQPPAVYCQMAAELGFPGKGYDYHYAASIDAWQCHTPRLAIIEGEPADSELRYRVLGSETEVQSIELELNMLSWQQPQRVLHYFAAKANLLHRLLTGKPLPAQVKNSILGQQSPQRWTVMGYDFNLLKKQNHGRNYDLVLRAQDR